MKRLRIACLLESLAAAEPYRQASAVAAALPMNEFDVRFYAPRGRSFGEPWRLANVAADVIHLTDAWSATHVGPLLAVRRRIPYLCTVADYRREATRLRRRVERFVYRRAATIVSADPDVAARRRAECGLQSTPAWQVLDSRSLFPPTITSDREAVCAELGVPPAARLLGAFGPLTAAQNMRDVVWLDALLRLLYEDTYLLLFGDGPKRTALQAFAAAMHVTDRVRFVADPAAFDRVLPQLAIYVDAARWSGPSYALFAAQAAGVPVVAIDTPVRRREVLAERSGYLVNEHDRAALTRRCYQLLENESLRQSLGAAGRESAAAVRANAAATAAVWADLYRRAAAGR